MIHKHFQTRINVTSSSMLFTLADVVVWAFFSMRPVEVLLPELFSFSFPPPNIFAERETDPKHVISRVQDVAPSFFWLDTVTFPVQINLMDCRYKLLQSETELRKLLETNIL